tara:strand:+ start:1106 stop:1444 length:339 start_codon:yes stop_codon:yes gene_type:complete
MKYHHLNQIDKENAEEPQFWRSPLDIDKYAIPQGSVHVIKHRCKGCNFCIEFCPNRVLKISEEFNAKGYHPPQVTNMGKCVACNLCELICPEFAIYITEECCENTQKGEKND